MSMSRLPSLAFGLGFAYSMYENWGTNTTGSIFCSVLSLLFSAVVVSSLMQIAFVRNNIAVSSLIVCVATYGWFRYAVFGFDFLYWLMFAYNPVVNPDFALFRAASLVANASVTVRVFGGAHVDEGVCFKLHRNTMDVVHSATRMASYPEFDTYDVSVHAVSCRSASALTADKVMQPSSAQQGEFSDERDVASSVLAAHQESPLSHSLNHDPVYISEISKERERWSAASTFTIKAAAIFPPLCGGRRRLQFSNLLSPLKLDPQDELMLVQQRLEFGPLPADAFFFEGHAFGEESSACADSHEEQVARVKWRVESVVSIIQPNWLRATLNLIWNIAANVAIEIVRSLLEGDRGRRSGSSVNIWNTEQAVIRAKVNAVTNPNGEVMLSLEERFDADSTTTFGPLSVLPLSYRKPKGSASTSSQFASSDMLTGTKQEQLRGDRHGPQGGRQSSHQHDDDATTSVHHPRKDEL